MTGGAATFEDRSQPPLVLPRDIETAVPLREAPAWERNLRYVLAALLTACLAFATVERIRRPTVVQGGSGYGALMTAVQAGEVVRVDDTREDYVLWQRADGDVFAERRTPGVDVPASVEAQRRSASGARAVRFERIDAPPVGGQAWPDWVRGLGGLVLLGFVVTGPAPRGGTHWAWAWVAMTGIGAVAYLLLSGSRTRTSPQRPPTVTGVHGLVAAVAVSAFVWFVGTALVHDQPPGRNNPPPTELVRTGSAR